MRATNGDGIAEPHQLGQHLGAAHHRQQLFARCGEFRIALLDGGGNNHNLGITKIFGLVADMDRDTLVTQPLDVGALRLVGPLDAMTEIMQHLSDAAHADPADTDKMHKADGLRQLHTPAPLKS